MRSVRCAIDNAVVLDASAVVEFLVRDPAGAGDRVASRMRTATAGLWAPHLVDAEVGHVLRRHALRGAMEPEAAHDALLDLNDFPLHRVPHTALLRRAWELRESLTFYDSLYVSLAEELDAPLVTADARIARANGHRAHVEVID